MKIVSLFLWVGLCYFSVSAYAIVDNKTSVTRYALFVASNNGGADRAQLRYAESDAMSLAKVFQELGGLSSKNSTILLSPGMHQLTETIEDLLNGLKEAKSKRERVEFIFYYSGHSDENGLLLEDGKYEYKKLHKALGEVNADVKIAILDSCQSGAFTRLKGGQRTSPFLINAANQLKGNVYLTASSASEASQESDTIGASFFTHYLVSALRGASDVSGDKQITLNEAYQYAFQETLSQTENTQAGAQHPAYNIQIAGAGDLVLTNIEASNSTLIVPENLMGRLYIRDRNGSLVAELNKLTNKEISIALRPNLYEVLWQQKPSLYSNSVSLSSGESKILLASDFVASDKIAYQERGAVDRKMSKFKRRKKLNHLSVGVYTISNQYRGKWNFDMDYDDFYPEQVESYAGYQINFARDISESSRIQFKFYEAAGQGVIRGVALGIDMDVLTLVNKGREKIEVHLGIFAFTEKLHNVPREMLLTIDEDPDDLDKAYSGLEIPVGIKLIRKNTYFDIALNKRIRERYNPKSTTDWLPSIGLVVGYSL